MTISISGTASGSDDHSLSVRRSGEAPVVYGMGAFSFTLWKGAPVVLREVGDESVLQETADAVVAATTGTVKFAFDLDQKVIVKQTGQEGIVLGRADYRDFNKHQYSVRHINGQGDLVEPWYTEDQLQDHLEIDFS